MYSKASIAYKYITLILKNFFLLKSQNLLKDFKYIKCRWLDTRFIYIFCEQMVVDY